MRRHAGVMSLLTDLSLAMRTDPLALIRGATEFVTVIYGPAVAFAFPDVMVEAYRRSAYQQWTEVHLTGVVSAHYER